MTEPMPLPGGDPRENVRRLQALLDRGGEVRVEEPGVYPISGMLVIHGGTALRFGRGVILLRAGGEGGVLVNRGALTGETDEDILVEGLRLECAGYEGTAGERVPGLNGQLSFYRVRRLTIRDAVCLDLPKEPYFIHLSNWEHVLIDTIWVEGRKDGVHVNRGEHLHLVNGRFRTFDDPVALNAHDYLIGCPELGWIRDVVVEQCVDLDQDSTTGFFARILGGAWLDWKKGQKYRHSDAAVGPNGYVYRVVARRDLTEYVSEYAPCHEKGDVTYPDGITWRCVQHDTVYDCGCENIVFRDITLAKKRPVALSIHYDNDQYSRSCYPGARAVPQKNILFDHLDCRAPIDTLIYVKTPADWVWITHSSLRAKTLVTLAKPIFEDMDNNRETRVVLDHSRIERPEGEEAVTCVRACEGRRAKVRMDSFPGGDFALVSQGDVTDL